jgi:hypothetical protein
MFSFEKHPFEFLHTHQHLSRHTARGEGDSVRRMLNFPDKFQKS